MHINRSIEAVKDVFHIFNVFLSIFIICTGQLDKTYTNSDKAFCITKIQTHAITQVFISHRNVKKVTDIHQKFVQTQSDTSV